MLALLSVVFATLLVACDAPEDSSTGLSEPTATIAEATPTPGAPPPPMVTSTPSATPTEDDAYGIAVVDVETDAATVLHEGNSALFLTRAHGVPPFSRSDSVWLSPTTSESIRYAPDGTVLDRIEGWGVLESPDRETRSYFVGEDPAVTLVVEHDGERHEVHAGGATWRAFSPDGAHIAWTSPADPLQGALHILHIASGDLARIVNDASPPLTWSPSGRYLAFGSRQSGTAVVDVRDGTEVMHIDGRLASGNAWLAGAEDEWLLTLAAETQGAPTVTAIGSGDMLELPMTAAEDAWVLGEGMVVAARGSGINRSTIVFEISSDDIVLELQGEADVALTPGGVASAVIARSELACTGIEIVHPAATQQLPCDADFARWSPDGRHLALVPTSATAPVEILDLATGDIREVPHAGPRGTVPRWSGDGRYLVWMWSPQP